MKKETIAKVFTTLALNYRTQFDQAQAAATQRLWWQMFKGYNDEVFETAAIAIVNSLHYFPNVADIRKAIEELLREESVRPSGISGFLAAAERSEPTEFGRQCAVLIRRRLSGAAIDDDPLFQRIKADTLNRIGPFARSLFPAISDELIWRNSLEFTEAQQAEEMCGRCIWLPKECPARGHVPKLALQPDGTVVVTMKPCGKAG